MTTVWLMYLLGSQSYDLMVDMADQHTRLSSLVSADQ